MLTVIILMIPLAGAILLLLTKHRIKGVLFAVSAVTLAFSIYLFKDAINGNKQRFVIPLPGPFTPVFRVDSLSAIFIVLAAFIWFAVSIFTPAYMEKEGGSESFEFVTLLVFTSVLGIFLAGDLFTLLFFFEIMTVTSYFWVVHRRNKDTVKAGYYYLFFNIAGGLLLALAIALMGEASGLLPEIGSGPVIPLYPRLFNWSLALFVAGFGIKAGMAPLHLWLPYAHSAAPAPGSALLSGVLLKIGAYGLIRTAFFTDWDLMTENRPVWLGTALIIIGICTMLTGVAAALLQTNAKKLLAYHSVSQMGYIILGLGIALYIGGTTGALGLIGAIYHIINHALFKVALFLGVGIIYLQMKEINLYKLGGLWRRFPITAILMLLAVMGITGAPGLNGYASKTLLHHAISAAAGNGARWLVWTEHLFSLVGVGTAASFTKLFYLIFLGKPAYTEITPVPSPWLRISVGVLVASMLLIGIRPSLLPDLFIVPGLWVSGIANYPAAFADSFFWNPKDIVSIFITLAIGILACMGGLKSGLFHWTPPVWMTLEGLIRLMGRGIFFLLKKTEGCFRYLIKAGQKVGEKVRTRILLALGMNARSEDSSVGRISLMGISADVMILVLALIVLIGWYTLADLGL